MGRRHVGPILTLALVVGPIPGHTRAKPGQFVHVRVTAAAGAAAVALAVARPGAALEQREFAVTPSLLEHLGVADTAAVARRAQRAAAARAALRRRGLDTLRLRPPADLVLDAARGPLTIVALGGDSLRVEARRLPYGRADAAASGRRLVVRVERGVPRVDAGAR
jgi:hypothetical protein